MFLPSSKSLSTFTACPPSRYNIPVYATEKTWSAMPVQSAKIDKKLQRLFSSSIDFTVGDLQLHPFSIPHDAIDPCGFNIKSTNSEQISIATDIGHMTRPILNNLENSKFILLESNYDTEVLRCCSYPYKLKSRIASDIGHLSNSIAGKTISYLLKNGNLSTAMLGHLSKESNFPELAYQTVVDELIANNNDSSFNLSVANRDYPSNFIKL